MRFLITVGNIFVYAGFLVSAITGLVFINEMLRRHPLSFLAFWAFVPIVSWWLNWQRRVNFLDFIREDKHHFNVSSSDEEIYPAALEKWYEYQLPSSARFFTQNALKTLASFLVASAFLLSFLVFLNWQSIRDNVGKHYLQGYFAVDGDAAYAEHWYAKSAIRLFEGVLVIGVFAFPAVTLTLTRKALDCCKDVEEYRRACHEHEPRGRSSIQPGTR